MVQEANRRVSAYFFVVLPIFGLLLNGLIYESLPLGIWQFFLVDAVFYLLLPVTCTYVLLRVYKFPGLKLLPEQINFPVAVIDITVATIVLFFLYFGSVFILGRLFTYEGASFSYGEILDLIDQPQFRFLGITYFAATGAIVEEIFYRRFLYVAILWKRDSFCRRFAYVVLSSVLFSLSHWEQGVIGTTAALVFGVAAALVYLNYRYLLALIFPHFVVIFVAFL